MSRGRYGRQHDNGKGLLLDVARSARAHRCSGAAGGYSRRSGANADHIGCAQCTRTSLRIERVSERNRQRHAGRTFGTSLYGSRVDIYDANSNIRSRQLRISGKPCNASFAFAPDGRVAVAINSKKVLQVFETRSRSAVITLARHQRRATKRKGEREVLRRRSVGPQRSREAARCSRRERVHPHGSGSPDGRRRSRSSRDRPSYRRGQACKSRHDRARSTGRRGRRQEATCLPATPRRRAEVPVVWPAIHGVHCGARYDDAPESRPGSPERAPMQVFYCARAPLLTARWRRRAWWPGREGPEQTGACGEGGGGSHCWMGPRP